MDELVVRHRRACGGFARVAHAVPASAWTAPTPCSEWTARDVVEHVIGFHDFLLLRPLGARANRPRDGAAERWDATARTLFDALADDDVLDRATELPGGGRSTPRTMLAALTTDVLVHTWDLGRATGADVELDDELCDLALRAGRASGLGRDTGLVGPEIPVAESAGAADKLIAFYGRDPDWRA